MSRVCFSDLVDKWDTNAKFAQYFDPKMPASSRGWPKSTNRCSTARIIVDYVPHYNVGQGLTPRRMAHAAEIMQVFDTLPPNLNVLQLHIETDDILGKGRDLILLGKSIARAFPKLRAVEWSKARLRSTNVNVTPLIQMAPSFKHCKSITISARLTTTMAKLLVKSRVLETVEELGINPTSGEFEARSEQTLSEATGTLVNHCIGLKKLSLHGIFNDGLFLLDFLPTVVNRSNLACIDFVDCLTTKFPFGSPLNKQLLEHSKNIDPILFKFCGELAYHGKPNCIAYGHGIENARAGDTVYRLDKDESIDEFCLQLTSSFFTAKSVHGGFEKFITTVKTEIAKDDTLVAINVNYNYMKRHAGMFAHFGPKDNIETTLMGVHLARCVSGAFGLLKKAWTLPLAGNRKRARSE